MKRQNLHVSWNGFRLSWLSWFCGFACAAAPQPAKWPAFRGPNGDGIAESANPPVHFNSSSNVLWKAESPPGHSSPVVWDERLFLTGAGERDLATLCLDRTTGKKLWEKRVQVEKMEPVHKANSHATSTPVTDGKRVYAYFGSFGLLAYDFEGKEVWRKPLPTPQTFFNQGSGTSPILVGETLVVFVQVGNGSHLLGVNPASGQEIWKAPMPVHNNSYASPVSWQENGQRFVGMACAGRFSAFKLGADKETWWVEGTGYQACATPVTAGDRLIITSAGVQGELANMTPLPAFEEMIKKYDQNGDGQIALEEVPADLLFTDRHTSDGKGDMSARQALSMFGGVKNGQKLDREKWEAILRGLGGFRTGPMNRTIAMAVRTGGKDDVTKSNVMWQETKGVPEVPSPLIWRGRVYLVRSGGLLVCRDLENGKLIYEERIESPGGYFASPILANGRIYLASDRGTVTVVKAGDAVEVLGRNELGEAIMASPAPAANTLYIRSATKLWAFKSGKT